jgi:hypothetical protein
MTMVAGFITWDETYEEYPVYFFQTYPDGKANAYLSEEDLEDLRRIEAAYVSWQDKLAKLVGREK